MSGWSEEELADIGRADEIRVTSRRPDGTLRGFVTIWSVRVGGRPVRPLGPRPRQPVVSASAQVGAGAGPGRRSRARRRLRGAGARSRQCRNRRVPREVRPLRAGDRWVRGLCRVGPVDAQGGARLARVQLELPSAQPMTTPAGRPGRARPRSSGRRGWTARTYRGRNRQGDPGAGVDQTSAPSCPNGRAAAGGFLFGRLGHALGTRGSIVAVSRKTRTFSARRSGA